MFVHNFSLPVAKSMKERGSSLLEVLVSILVFSFGLLGMAGLSTASLGYNKIAQVRNTGTLLVNDYAERARFNPLAFDNGAYNISNSDSQTSQPTAPAIFPGISKDAAAISVANYDKQYWLYELRQRLPGGGAVVESTTPAAGSNSRERILDVWIYWNDSEESGSVLASLNSAKCSNRVAGKSCMYFRVAL